MEKIKVIYWSQTGNTQEMAKAIGQGIIEGGKEAEVVEVDKVNAMDLKDASVVALGCPAMGAEVLEESEMEPFVEEFTKISSGKHVSLFGSYGWGDGQWMRDWQERMEEAGADIINGEGLMCHEVPDEAAIEECKVLGKQLAGLK